MILHIDLQLKKILFPNLFHLDRLLFSKYFQVSPKPLLGKQSLIFGMSLQMTIHGLSDANYKSW